MKVIGFAEQYYTLWNVEKTIVEMNRFQTKEKTHFLYIQNLSKDFDKAKAKVNEPFELDLDLKGDKREFYTEGEPQGVIPNDVFKNGKYRFEKIADCIDIKYVLWYYSETNNECALKVLLNNGFQLVEGVLYNAEDAKKQKHSLGLKRGHLFEDKKRIELKIKTIESFSFEGHYGRTYIEIYETSCGCEVKYMGSNPPNISDEVFESVKVTIKHDNYSDLDETKIQRISKS
jgi:hypothetical protein